MSLHGLWLWRERARLLIHVSQQWLRDPIPGVLCAKRFQFSIQLMHGVIFKMMQSLKFCFQVLWRSTLEALSWR